MSKITIDFNPKIFEAIFGLGIAVKMLGQGETFKDQIYTMEVFMGNALQLWEEQFKPGAQIICIPNHANGDMTHEDCECGFITSIANDSESAFCRYWSKHERGDLRTKANSENTPFRNLELYQCANPRQLREIIAKYEIEIQEIV